MKKPLRKLPIGVQDFPSLREDGYLYVDKTALVYQLATENKAYFLSRPRRFGKSLLISTLGAYFEGRRECFEGLAIAELEDAWTEYPVLRLDLNAERYHQPESLHAILNAHLERWELLYGSVGVERSLPERFFGVIEKAHLQTGKRAVVLVDEYDKPLLTTLDNPELLAEMKAILKPFYGVLKSADAHLKFVFLTGVTKFGQVSVFSDLNQLRDLTLDPTYATLCGLTFQELQNNFGPEIEALAFQEELSVPECLEKIKTWYNGYQFFPNAEGVFNPFSTLLLFQTRVFAGHWFQTGTPTFLVELLKKSDYDLRELEGVQLSADQFANYRADADQPLPVLYQSGYLTIKGYNRRAQIYTLGYPNAEVKYGFLSFLNPDYTGLDRDKSGINVYYFCRDLEQGDIDSFMTRLQAFFGGIPYELETQNEKYYQMVLYVIFTLLGQYVRAEIRFSFGRADLIVENDEHVYLFELKLFDTAENALQQIEDKGYAVPYGMSSKQIHKIGVEFDPAKRNVGRWLIA
jgi:hypothetical protein